MKVSEVIQLLQSDKLHPVRYEKMLKCIMPCRNSLIIPSRGEGLDLVRTIQSLKQSGLSNDTEIIVVENGSDDDISDVLPAFNGIYFFSNQSLGVHKARAMGAEIAMGRNLIFLDGHLRVDSHFIRDMEKALEDCPDAVLCSASRSWKQDGDWTIFGCNFEYKDGKLNHSYNLAEPDVLYSEIFKPTGACYAMTRETFQHIGGFPTLFRSWGVSEADLGVRAWLTGKRVVCHKGVITYHKYRSKFPYPVSNTDIDYNWCVLALSLFSLGAAWPLFVNPALERGGIALRTLLLNNFEEIMAYRSDFQKKKKHDIDWLWGKFSKEGMPQCPDLSAAEIKENIAYESTCC